MENKYRIAEYKENYVVECKTRKVKRCDFNFFFGWLFGYVFEEKWIEIPYKKFYSIEEAQDFINDIGKYPIYHYI